MAHNGVRLYIVVAALVIPVVAGPVAAAAATLRVEANGTDTTTCGPAPAPCRTINQAIFAFGAPLTVRGNVARDNGRFGIRAQFPTTGVVRDNVAIANLRTGLEVTGTVSTGAVLVTRNSLLSNGTGVTLFVGEASMAVTGNNLYDNRDGCGLVLEGPPSLDATGNFWGAPTGPGGGSADTACRRSSQAQIPDTSPFLRAPVVVRPVKPRL